jgi:hypothetical protein
MSNFTITPLTDAEAVDGLIGEWSDTYKSFEGIRPRWDFERMSHWDPMRIRNHIDDFVAGRLAWEKEMELAEAAEKAAEAAALVHGVGPTLTGALEAALREAI